MDDTEISSFGRWQWSNGFNTALTAVGIDLKKLPSAQPERKKGKWLDGHRAGYGETLYWYIYCSECLYERDDDDHDKDTPFCPNCGVWMVRGEQDE